MSVFGKHCDFYWFILYVNAPCQAYFDTWLETWLVTESNLRLFFCLACVICSDSLDTTLLDYSSLSTFSVVSVYCICCDICEERKKKIKHPWEEDHKRHDWVTMLRKCVCKCSKGEVWPSALNPTDSVCGVSLGVILDYSCNNPRHPLGNMLIAQIGIFSFLLHTAGPRRISQTLTAFQTLIIRFSYWIWYPAPAARIPNLEFLEPGWLALGHKCI